MPLVQSPGHICRRQASSQSSRDARALGLLSASTHPGHFSPVKTGRCVASPGISAYSSNLERARRGRKEGGREDTEVRPRLKCFSLQSHQVHGQQGGLSHGVPPAGTSARAPERLFPNSWQVSLSVYSRPHLGFGREREQWPAGPLLERLYR